MPSLRTAVLVLASSLAPLAAAQNPCQPQWVPTFGGAPQFPARIATYDDGTGPALYGAHVGSFSDPTYVGRWDGARWTKLGGDITHASQPFVRALCGHSGGPIRGMYAAGQFDAAGGVPAANIARWDGAAWSALGSGVAGTVEALTVFDDGSGPALYAAGLFASAGGVPANSIARWNGASWSALGGGVFGTVRALAVFDDGSGPALYVGGQFPLAGGVGASNVARWDGTSWSALGAGLGSGDPQALVEALEVFDDGSGARLYAGGRLGSNTPLFAKWTGASWQLPSPALGSYFGPLAAEVYMLRTYDAGSGPALYVGGFFDHAGGLMLNGIARWNGSGWSSAGSLGLSGFAFAAEVFDDGHGARLFACVGASADTLPVAGLAAWDGSAWHHPGSGPDGQVNALASCDLGQGPALYAAGTFRAAADAAAGCIACWSNERWSTLGIGLENQGPGSHPPPPDVRVLASYDDGSGSALYVGGFFSHAGGVQAPGLARWDGASWSAIAGAGGLTTALKVFDDGSGPKLFIGTGYPAIVSTWDGSSLSGLTTGPGNVHAFEAFDDGSGPALYAGGSFDAQSGMSGLNLSRWNGTSWSSVGDIPALYLGLPPVRAMAVFDDGSGPALYVAGTFASAGGVAAANIARWNGQSWSPVGGGFGGQPGSTYVRSLCVHDDGSGAALYAGGMFDTAGGAPIANLAKWDGTSWSAVPVDRLWVGPLAVHDDGSGPALIVGLSSELTPSGDSWIAKWASRPGCGAPGTIVCEPGVGGVIACPCANPPAGAGRGCDNSSLTGGAELAASGIARITYDTVVFTTSGETPSATSIVLQGNALAANGSVFGQGVRCVAGGLKRLYVKQASGGSIRAPSSSEPGVHARSAALGNTIVPGSHRYYGVYYRDPIVLGGCAAASTFNVTQQLSVLWAP